jgi:hypothetical protein
MHSTVQHFTAPPLQRNTDCDSVVQHCTAHVQGYRHCTSAFWIHSPAILLKFLQTKKELSVSTVHNILSSRLCAPRGTRIPEFPNCRMAGHKENNGELLPRPMLLCRNHGSLAASMPVKPCARRTHHHRHATAAASHPSPASPCYGTTADTSFTLLSLLRV